MFVLHQPETAAEEQETEMSKLPIPDLRFESSFRRSLESEARVSTSSAESRITPYIVAKVVLRDQLLMPLVQGIIYSAVLILAKPWLVACAASGRRWGVQMFQSLGLK